MRRYFEFAVAVILVALLALVLMNALRQATSDMEEASVQAEAASIRTQLLERVVHREAFGGPLPASDNPVDWIVSRPPNYLGELDAPPLRTGVWHFDRKERVLVYRFRDGRVAGFRLSREAGSSGARGVVAGIGLLRLDGITEQGLRK